MGASSIVRDIAGVRTCLVGDRAGRVNDQTGAPVNAAATLSAASRSVDGLTELGTLLGLGPLELFTTKTPAVAYVVAQEGEAVIVVGIDPSRPTTPVEAAVRTSAWATPIEWDVSDADIEEVNGEARRQRAELDFEESPTRPGRAVLPGMDPTLPSVPPSAARPTVQPAADGAGSTVTARPAALTARPSASTGRLSPITTRAGTVGLLDANARSATRLVAAAPAFTGSLETIGVPDLLEFLRNGQRTGALVCGSNAAIGVVHMRGGNIVGAAVPSTRPLSEYLLAAGYTTAPAVDALTRRDAGVWTRATAATEVVRSGIVTVGQVRQALGHQIRHALRELVTWTRGDFSFDSENALPSSEHDADLAFETPSLLMDIFNDLDGDATASS
jgi:hypothetical protein